MAAGKIRKKFLWITGFFLLTTVIGANRALAASPLFFKYWENAQSAESSNEPDKATEQYEKAFRELQIQPWSAGMRLFEHIDHLVKFFLDTKHYSDAEQCLKFAITIGGSYKFDQQLADLYNLAGKADLARETEDNMREWIAQNAENWNTTAAMRFQRFYAQAHMQSAQALKKANTYEVTLDNGMTFDLPVNRVNFGNGTQTDLTLPADAQTPAPENMVQLAEKKCPVILFKGIKGPTNDFDYCLAIEERNYQATLTSDCQKEYLSQEQIDALQDMRPFSPELPISTVTGKQKDKDSNWCTLTLDRKAYWAINREIALTIPEAEAASINEGDRILVFSASNGGFESFRILSLENGHILKQVSAVEAPYRPPMRAMVRWQRPKDYGLEYSLAQEASVLTNSTLSDLLDRSRGETISASDPELKLSMPTPRVVCHANLANGMSFDLLVKLPYVSPPNTIGRPHQAPETTEVDPLDANPILADKGAPVTVLAKPVKNGDGPENDFVYSVFVGGQLCEAIPTKSLSDIQKRDAPLALRQFKGMGFSEIQKIQPADKGQSILQLENGTTCSISSRDAEKMAEHQTAILFWQPDNDQNKFKILTQAGIFAIFPPDKNLAERSAAISTTAANEQNPSAWASRGWWWSLTGPNSMAVQVAYPLEIQQAAAIATASADPSFSLPKWNAQFAWGLREIWWDLVTHAEPKTFKLGADLNNSAVPKIPALKSDPQPVMPPTYLTGKAQVLITIERDGNAPKVTAKILNSDLADRYNNALVASIEANAQHTIFKLPNIHQFDHASFLVQFSLPKTD